MIQAEGGCFLAAAVLALIVVPIVIYAVRSAVAARRRLLERVAAALGGAREDRGFGSAPAIRFTIDGLPALLEFENGKHPWTRVTVDLRGKSPGTLQIVPHHFGHTLLKFFLGTQDVEIGDPVFDQEYVIKANPEGVARELFHPERRREAVDIVRRLAALGTPRVELTLGTLVLQTGRYLDDEGPLLDLARGAIAFTGYIVGAGPGVGIEFIEGTSTSPGRCQVCGSELVERVVRCASCRTPHHRECWEYAGECSTFACKERRFTA